MHLAVLLAAEEVAPGLHALAPRHVQIARPAADHVLAARGGAVGRTRSKAPRVGAQQKIRCREDDGDEEDLGQITLPANVRGPGIPRSTHYPTPRESAKAWKRGEMVGVRGFEPPTSA